MANPTDESALAHITHRSRFTEPTIARDVGHVVGHDPETGQTIIKTNGHRLVRPRLQTLGAAIGQQVTVSDAGIDYR